MNPFHQIPTRTTPAPSTEPGWRVYWQLTRPGFLSITAVAVVLGWSTAWACGCGFNPFIAVVSLVLALMTHAAGNVLNDHADACNGADAANTGGIFPFTGGSRLIQDGTVSRHQARQWVLALMAVVMLGGLWLALKSGPSLLTVGLVGLLLAWTYSYPPFKLMSRGLGELTVATAWWLVVVGADMAQRGSWMLVPAHAGVSLGVLVGNILLINGMPDSEGDRKAGKRTLATRLGPNMISVVYAGGALFAHLWVVVGVWALIPPTSALWALVSLPLSAAAWWQLHRHRRTPKQLKPAIILTIASANLHGLALAVGMVLPRWQATL